MSNLLHVNTQAAAWHCMVSRRAYHLGLIELMPDNTIKETGYEYQPVSSPVAMISTSAGNVHDAVIAHESSKPERDAEKRMSDACSVDFLFIEIDAASGGAKCIAHAFDQIERGDTTLKLRKFCSSHQNSLIEGAACSVTDVQLVSRLFSSCMFLGA